MDKPIRISGLACLACAALALGGCQVLASVFEDPVLLAITFGVATAAVVGFVVALMRRKGW